MRNIGFNSVTSPCQKNSIVQTLNMICYSTSKCKYIFLSITVIPCLLLRILFYFKGLSFHSYKILCEISLWEFYNSSFRQLQLFFRCIMQFFLFMYYFTIHCIYIAIILILSLFYFHRFIHIYYHVVQIIINLI